MRRGVMDDQMKDSYLDVYNQLCFTLAWLSSSYSYSSDVVWLKHTQI